MNEIWLDTFHGIIPRCDYAAHLSAGEASGLSIKLESNSAEVTISFGFVHAFQMLDEGVLLQCADSEQFAAIRLQNFPSTIYEIENGSFAGYLEAQMGASLFHDLHCRQYIIVTLNYVISVVASWPPEITVHLL